MLGMLARLKAFFKRFEVTLAGIVLLANLALSLSPLGHYLEEKLFLTPVFKVRAWTGMAPELDPAVRLGIVADVVERNVSVGMSTTRTGDDDIDVLLKSGEEQGRVVGDSRVRRRERRVVGDLHPSNLSMQ